MSEENKAIVSRFLDELWNQNNAGIRDELATPDYPSTHRVDEMRAGFPDIQLTIDDQIAEGDQVVTRATATGTHKGEFMGKSPTDRSITLPIIFIHRLEGGRVAERWNQMDQVGLYEQISATQN